MLAAMLRCFCIDNFLAVLAGSRDVGFAAMKDGIHPEYRPVVFMDTSNGTKFITRSTMRSKEKVQWEDGKEYPLVKVDISSASHPYFTGKMKFLDAAGRVEKFQKKYDWAKRRGTKPAEAEQAEG